MPTKPEKVEPEDMSDGRVGGYLCIGLVIYFIVGGIISYLITDYCLKDRDTIQGFDHEFLDKYPLVKAVDLAFDQAEGQEYVKEHTTMANDIARFRNRIKYFMTLILADGYPLLEKDIRENNGTCLAICKEFDSQYDRAVLNLFNDSFKNLAETMVKIRKPIKEALLILVKKIYENPEKLEDVEWFWSYSSILEPVRRFFFY